MAPSEYRSIDIDALREKYFAEGWDKRLPEIAARVEEWRTGNYKRHTKWFNAHNDVLAFVVEYDLPGGTTVVRELRDGGIMYFIE